MLMPSRIVGPPPLPPLLICATCPSLLPAGNSKPAAAANAAARMLSSLGLSARRSGGRLVTSRWRGKPRSQVTAASTSTTTVMPGVKGTGGWAASSTVTVRPTRA
jgi:hypothetical protein